ncbi:hypothetical protein Anapl_03874 [Anas platyrhynchos]|uniref:Uncharacterized protein n=1 Tax=Anas platyrhynchos TaxID=8839 RepID=R0L3R3_ANAPL|nr:hypothetical protein Anapl_03874 [Anas platyrhynchos]
MVPPTPVPPRPPDLAAHIINSVVLLILLSALTDPDQYHLTSAELGGEFEFMDDARPGGVYELEAGLGKIRKKHGGQGRSWRMGGHGLAVAPRCLPVKLSQAERCLPTRLKREKSNSVSLKPNRKLKKPRRAAGCANTSVVQAWHGHAQLKWHQGPGSLGSGHEPELPGSPAQPGPNCCVCCEQQ